MPEHPTHPLHVVEEETVADVEDIELDELSVANYQLARYREEPVVLDSASSHLRAADLNPSSSTVGVDRYSWILAVAAFCSFAVLSGLIFTFSMYHVALLEEFHSSRSYTAAVGSVQNAVYMLAGPMSSTVIRKIGLRYTVMLSGLVTCAGYISSSFVPNLEWLFLTYGIIGAVGSTLCYSGWVQTISTCCRLRYSLAFSIAQSGIGIGMFIFGNIYLHLIDLYGWRGSFLITGAISLHLTSFGMLIRPENKQRNVVVREELVSLMNARAWTLYLGSFFMFLATPVVYILLKDYTKSISLEESYIQLLSVLGAGDLIGRIITGPIIECCRINPIVLNAVSQLICCLSILFLLSVENSSEYLVLIMILMIFGITFGIQCVLLAVVPRQVFGGTNLNHVFGAIMFFGGVGTFLGSPIAGWLVDLTGTYSIVFPLAALAEMAAVITSLLCWRLSR